MTTYTIQGYSRVMNWDTQAYEQFGTATLQYVRPDGAGSWVHHYNFIDTDDTLVGMSQVHDFVSLNAFLSRPGGTTYDFEGDPIHAERFVYLLEWGTGQRTYMHSVFMPLTGEEFFFAMSGDAMPAITSLAQLGSLVDGARRWVIDGPFESGAEIPFTTYQRVSITENDRIVASHSEGLFWDAGIGNDTMLGGNANDTLLGGGGNDRIFTGLGNNVVMGGTGNDTITGNGDFNEIMGGAGNDSIASISNVGGVINGGGGADVITVGAGTFTAGFWTAYNTVNGGSGADRLTGAQANDWFRGDAGNDTLVGNAGDDDLYGGDHNDKIYGGAGNDRVEGDNGADLLSGGAGGDMMYGDAGADTLIGGAAADEAWGGAGADVFRFVNATDSTFVDSDQIFEFASGEDKIDLAAVDANSTVANDQAFAWRGAQAFTGLGQLRVVVSQGDTIILGNISGDLAADFRIVVQDVTGLTQANFLL